MIDYIIEGICLLFCIGHLLHSFLSGRSLSKKIDYACKQCGKPVVAGEEHKCDLNSNQMKALYDFVLSLKDNNGVDNGN